MGADKKIEYISKLLGREIKSDKDITEYENKIIKNALKKAWEIRNFEIKLYWQRALYFWGFIALAFYAPIVILKLKTDFILHPMLNKFFFITIICMLLRKRWKKDYRNRLPGIWQTEALSIGRKIGKIGLTLWKNTNMEIYTLNRLSRKI